MRLGALEAGGTKMVVAVGDELGNVLEQETFPTTSPEETISKIIAYFKEKEIEALGIGAFGPVDVRKDSKQYGRILNTPKTLWKQYPILEKLHDALQVPMEIDTDVNCSCLGEATFGCARGLNTVLYLTVGTGIGAGILAEGNLLHGMLHPEGGHIKIAKNPHDQGKCICPYHDSCMEGLASGPSIEARWGKKANELVNREVVWELESEYLAKGIVNMILLLSPQKVILGGGVMHQLQLFDKIRNKVTEYLNHYYDTEEVLHMEEYIVPASLNDQQGILGALELARIAKSGMK